MAGLGASEDQAVISWPGDVVRRGGLTRCLPSLSDIIGTMRMKLDPVPVSQALSDCPAGQPCRRVLVGPAAMILQSGSVAKSACWS